VLSSAYIPQLLHNYKKTVDYRRHSVLKSPYLSADGSIFRAKSIPIICQYKRRVHQVGTKPAQKDPKECDILTGRQFRRRRDENKSYAQMQRMQAKKLQHDKEQEEHAGPAGDEQILPVLP